MCKSEWSVSYAYPNEYVVHRVFSNVGVVELAVDYFSSLTNKQQRNNQAYFLEATEPTKYNYEYNNVGWDDYAA